VDTVDDKVFKALADPARRHLLDSLRERNGQTLGQLCGQLDMARQSATQHLGVLEAANLISTTWRGREKLHYLNPVPVHEIQERWIGMFERPRLRALSILKHRAEEQHMGGKPNFVNVTYIHATPEQVWHALTDADLTAEYWGHSNISDWQAGSQWHHQRTDGSGIADVTGTIVAATSPRRLVMTFEAPGEARAAEPSRVTFDI
jgi:DNA-binding transcriptional ArsR family regulator